MEQPFFTNNDKEIYEIFQSPFNHTMTETIERIKSLNPNDMRAIQVKSVEFEIIENDMTSTNQHQLTKFYRDGRLEREAKFPSSHFLSKHPHLLDPKNGMFKITSIGKQHSKIIVDNDNYFGKLNYGNIVWNESIELIRPYQREYKYFLTITTNICCNNKEHLENHDWLIKIPIINIPQSVLIRQKELEKKEKKMEKKQKKLKEKKRSKKQNKNKQRSEPVLQTFACADLLKILRSTTKMKNKKLKTTTRKCVQRVLRKLFEENKINCNIKIN